MNAIVDLFLFPYAGGNRYSFQGLSPFLSENIRQIPLEYPGRGARVREALLTNSELLADDLVAQVLEQLEHPFAFYGHSMGALMAYLVIKKLVAKKISPEYLFVTGATAPCCRHGESVRYQLPREAFIQEIKKMGGTSDEVLFNDELMDFFEPILKADLMALETYKYSPSSPMNIPIYVAIGSQECISAGQAAGWGRETTGAFGVHTFCGSHFFIFDHISALTKDISEHLLNKILAP